MTTLLNTKWKMNKDDVEDILPSGNYGLTYTLKYLTTDEPPVPVTGSGTSIVSDGSLLMYFGENLTYVPSQSPPWGDAGGSPVSDVEITITGGTDVASETLIEFFEAVGTLDKPKKITTTEEQDCAVEYAVRDSKGRKITETYVSKDDIVDNVTSTNTDKPLSANQGRILQNEITAVSNPNLLINGNFRVNQRGQTSYTGNVYSVDRWRCGNSTYNVANKSLITTAAWQGLMQYVEDWEALKGKTVTVSIKATSGSSGIRFGLKNGTTDLQFVDGLVNSSGILAVTFTIPNDANYTNFNVAVWNKGAETTTIEWCKLEIGSVATAFSPRPYAEELAMCQRYYWRSTATNSGNYAGWNNTSTVARCTVTLPQIMRTVPTFVCDDVSTINIVTNGAVKHPTAVEIQQYSNNNTTNQITLSLTASDLQQFQPILVRLLQQYSFDAEIY